MGAAIELLESALSQIRVGQLVKYTLRYGEDAVIKRLGWTLEQLGVSPENVEHLRAVESGPIIVLIQRRAPPASAIPAGMSSKTFMEGNDLKQKSP
jgi:hypothetical protein